MRILTASAQNGRPVMDEPTDLPDGAIVELVSCDNVLASGGDLLDAEDQAALDRELEASFDDEAAGRLIDIADVLADLRNRHQT